MDDLKLFAKHDNLEGLLLQTVKNFRNDKGIKFGLDRCVKTTLETGKLIKCTLIKLENNAAIKGLEQEEVYEYLGASKTNGIQYATLKENIRKECYLRVTVILRAELN